MASGFLLFFLLGLIYSAEASKGQDAKKSVPQDVDEFQLLVDIDRALMAAGAALDQLWLQKGSFTVYSTTSNAPNFGHLPYILQ